MKSIRITVTDKKIEAIKKSVRRLLTSSRSSLLQNKGEDYVQRWRFFVNEPDYAQAYGLLSCLYFLGILQSMQEVQNIFSEIQDDVLSQDLNWTNK
jgi:hypothetical protein